MAIKKCHDLNPWFSKAYEKKINLFKFECINWFYIPVITEENIKVLNPVVVEFL